MAYDEELAERIRSVLGSLNELPRGCVTERRMFGGIAFLVHGNMCCGLNGERLMLRLGKEGAEAALCEPHTAEMDFTGRPMPSMVYVERSGVATTGDLSAWVGRAASFALALPPK